MSGVPFAYIRRSATGVSGGDISREFQTDAVRALVGEDATLVVIDSDWGRSGSRQKRAKRTGFADLLAAVRDGGASAVYAYAADRLARDTEAAIALLNACETARIPIVTREGTFAPGDRSARLLFGVQAMTNEDYSSQASEKRLATVRVMRERGQRLGVQPYGELPGEDVQPVLDAFVTAGSYNGAVRLLNAGPVKPRRGEAWESTSVMRIVKRNEHRLDVKLPTRRHRGSRTLALHTFARLILCPYDDSVLTATNRTDRKGPAVGYFCRLARRSADHPKPSSVGERVILDWAKYSLGQTYLSQEVRLRVSPSDVAEQEALQDKRRRLVQVYVEGDLTEAAYRERLADIDADLTRLNAATQTTMIGWFGLRWNELTAPELNARLREVLHAIVLNAAMRPVGGIWLREPTVPDPHDDERLIPNPAAALVPGGWYLPTYEVTGTGTKKQLDTETTGDLTRPVGRIAGDKPRKPRRVPSRP